MRRNPQLDATEHAADDELVRQLAACTTPMTNDADLAPLLDRIGDARYVLIGEASHGTHEFYHWRARLTRRLIAEKGFSFVAVEGDWPDCYRVNRYVKGLPDAGPNAYEVLHAFDRWPTWMWANHDVVAFAEWLRTYNQATGGDVGFYGLDVYSLWDSLHAVHDYLTDADPPTARHAETVLQCFEPYGDEPQAYAHASQFAPETCESAVISLLVQLLDRRETLGQHDAEAYFAAEQNALVVRNAERYYRAMMKGNSASWNVRDLHMADTLDRLMRHHPPGAKAVVWEHNTHIGDARATDMALAGMVNLGQLVRQRHGEALTVLIGFSSYAGSVIAATAWEAPMRQMTVPKAEPGSWDELLHRYLPADKLLIFPPEGATALQRTRGQRAIGVVYHPQYERFGNFVPTRLADRYDALIHLDRTRAIQPLHMAPRHLGEPPETYPWAV